MIGATLVLPSDRVPYVVVKQEKDVYWLKPVAEVNVKTGHLPSSTHNGFPVWDHRYTEEELERLVISEVEPIRVTLSGECAIDAEGLEYFIGVARYYRDYSD